MAPRRRGSRSSVLSRPASRTTIPGTTFGSRSPKRRKLRSGGAMPPLITTAPSSIFRRETPVTACTTISPATGRARCKASPDMNALPCRILAANLPGFRLQAKGKERSTFVFHGGYDSFVEEFYAFLLPLTELGFTVIAFDGPGQGGALRQGIYFEHAWEKPAKALLDYFELDAVEWLGASCGGYLSIRAAAFEPRIKHIISLPTTYSGLDMTLKQMRPGKAQQLVSMFKAGDRKATEALVAEERLPSSVFDWCVTQGMHITGTKTPYDFLTAIAKHSLEGILHHVKQDILLTEGEQDHLFNVEWMYRTMRELVCARSVTARIFTAREGAEQHCQLGNTAVARDEIVCWLARFYPDLRAIPVRSSPSIAGAAETSTARVGA